ncbi:MAG TPA: DnaB-like helicase C-terminal domain-containing protein [Candidatus Acidoferrales bacterium]|nr:DnaB-like helicase C-terminal domain-containing protein [Candidatus Acidoferrales bacterium]
MFDRPLPESVDTERLILGACLVSPKNMDTAAEEINAQDFSLEKHKRIFQRMLDLRAMSVSVDRVTLAEALMSRDELDSVDGLSYLVGLDAGLPEIVNLKDYIDIVKEKARLRTLIVISNDTVQRALNCDQSAEVIQALEGQLYVQFSAPARTGTVRMSDWIAGRIKEDGPEKLLNPRLKQGFALTTGIRQLDEWTGGGFHDGEVWTVGAFSSSGKSALALQIATHVMDKLKLPVLFFSLEMTQEVLFQRLICQRAGVPMVRFIAGELSSAERTRVIEATDWVQELPFYVDETSSLTPAQLAIKTRRAKEERGVVLAMLDYLQLMRSSDSRHNDYQRVTEVSNGVRMTAKITVPFLNLSQFSRDPKKAKREPGKEDLKGSGSLENDSNVVLIPWCKDADSADTAASSKYDFIVAKNRNGRRGKIPMRFFGWRMLFVPEEEVQKDDPEPPRTPYYD